MIMYSFYCRKKRFNSCNGYDEFHAERYQKAIRAKSIFTGSDIRPEKTRFTNTSFWQSDPFPGQRIRQPDLSAEYFRQIHDRRSSIPGNLFLPLILNCHHVAAVLLTILQKNENRQKNKTAQAATPLSNWVQRLYTAIRPSSPDALDNKEQDSISHYKLLFVLSPDQSDKRLFLNICRARYKPTGEFSSISPLAEPDTLFSEKPGLFCQGR